MQPYQQFLIAPYKTGLDTDETPWLLPVDAFSSIIDGHLHHGYVQKRAGISFLAQMEHDTGPSTLRMMGIYQYLLADNTNITLVFDTRRAGILDFTNNTVIPLDTTDIFSSGEFDYIWAVNYFPTRNTNKINRLYYTNGLTELSGVDGIQYYESATGSATTTTSVTPFITTIAPVVTLVGAKILVVLKGYLIALNVTERVNSAPPVDTNFPQRARWCARLNSDVWLEKPNGNGGFADATTGGHIISARALQDQVIVLFTDSVWSLRYTGNINKPFEWFRIDDFSACGGKMATAGYDRYVMALGIRGITATDVVETRRADQRIEDFTSDVIDVSQFRKVFCLRDYTNRRLWTLYSGLTDQDPPDVNENNSVLVLDEESGAWSTYSISMNCLGYGQQTEDWVFDDFDAAHNKDISFFEGGDDQFDSYFWQSGTDLILGGTTNGEIYILQTSASEAEDNISLNITSAAWNPFKEEGREAQFGYIDFYVEVDPITSLQVSFYKNSESNFYSQSIINCVPEDYVVGPITNVTQSNPAVVSVGSHGLATGDQIYIQGVEGMEDINDGPYTVTVINEDSFSLDSIDSSGFSAYTGGGTAVKTPSVQGRVWKRAYSGAIGYEHSVNVVSSGTREPLKIYAFRLGMRPRGRRTIQ